MKRHLSPATLDLERRSSGILMHVTSLPGPHGSGDLGREAHRFLEFLAGAGQTWWQVLPVGPCGRAPGFSPYDSASAFAGSPALVSLGELARAGWLAEEDLIPARGFRARTVEFPLVLRFREERLARAFGAFRREPPSAERESEPGTAERESEPGSAERESGPGSAARERGPGSAARESGPGSAARESGPGSAARESEHGDASHARERRSVASALRAFRAAHSSWLEDYALFAALRRESGGRAWTEWECGVRTRDESSLRAARERLADEVSAECFVQLEFDRQWRALREAAHRRGIGLIGDLPIFVAHDSADVWSHPELFRLDRSGRPKRVSGYPPDRFNADGQVWGHPQYDWAMHEGSGFDWWLRRFARMFELFDALRVDHFLGFNRTWSIAAPARDARRGRWVKSPGFALFAALERKLGRLPLIAEDLGHVTADDIRLRETFGLAPMRIFQFGFGLEPDSGDHLPHAYARRTAAYTGNHDTDTTKGWFRGLASAEQERVLAYADGTAATIARSALRALMASHADTVVCPMQDLLELDGRARMNRPGTAEGNWRWRMPPMDLEHHARALRDLSETFGRSSAA